MVKQTCMKRDCIARKQYELIFLSDLCYISFVSYIKKAKSWRLALLQCCQLKDKLSRHISRDIWNFLQYFKLVVCLFHYISKFLSIYTRISHGIPYNVVRNPCCDPGLLYGVNTFSVSERSHVSRWSDNAYEYCDKGHSSLLTTGWRRIG